MSAGPTIAGFIEFVTNVMGAPNPPFDPANPSVQTNYAFNASLQIVNMQLQSIPNPTMGWAIYDMCVYNLAADYLIQWSQDANNAPVYKDGLPYWQYLRKQFGVLSFTPGVIAASSDQGTSTTYAVSEQLMGLLIGDLQNLKTPYGRAYLGFAGSWGSLWGMS